MSQFGGREIIQEWVVNVGGDIEDLRRAMREVSSETSAAQRASQRAARGIRETFQRTFSIVRTGAVAAAAGIGVLAGAIGTVSELTHRAERRNRALARALGLTGQEADDVISRFDRMADSLRDTGGVLRREFMQSAAIVADLTRERNLPVDEVRAMAVAAEGLATRFEHMGLTRERAARIIARAQRGEQQSLERYGINIDQAMDAQQQFEEILRLSGEGLRENEQRGRSLRSQLRGLRDEFVQLIVVGGRAAGFGEDASEMLGRFQRMLRSLRGPIRSVVSNIREWIESLNLVERGHIALELGLPGVVEGFTQLWEEIKIKAAETFNWILDNVPEQSAIDLLRVWTRAIDEIRSLWDRLRATIEHPIQMSQFQTMLRMVEREAEKLGLDIDDPNVQRNIRQSTVAHMQAEGAAPDVVAAEQNISRRREQSERRLQERLRRLREGEGAFDVDAMRQAAEERRAEFRKEHEERIAQIKQQQRERKKETDEVRDRNREVEKQENELNNIRFRPGGRGEIDTIQTAIGGMRVGASAQIAHLRRIERAAEKTARNTDPQHPARRQNGQGVWRAE